MDKYGNYLSEFPHPGDNTTVMHNPVSKSLNPEIISDNPVLTDLKSTDATANASSEHLRRMIRDEIFANGGAISFARYMQLALYAPGLGYYSGRASKLGVPGDFVTAPEISPLFSHCIARQCQQVLEIIGTADILEVGAGSGTMACEILNTLEHAGTLPDHYFILEVSADLRERQQRIIQQRIPHLQQHVYWLDSLPDKCFKGVVLANELLDAMPVHRVHIGKDTEQEYCIRIREDEFEWCLFDIDNDYIRQRTCDIRQMLGGVIDDDGYITEINLAAESWIRSIGELLDCGVVIIIDYGFHRREYYHPQRREGTLMCHYRHRSHADPLILTGLQDITSHIDFTALAEAGDDTGLNVAGFTTQGHFLLASGLLEFAEERQSGQAAGSPIEALQQAQEIKKLTLPHEMGELFKVLALSHGIDMPLLGFSLKDDRARL